MAKTPKLPLELTKLIEEGLFERLPATFSTRSLDRIKDWKTLFPAERDYFQRLFMMLDRSDRQAVQQLFAPLRATEEKIGVNRRTWSTRKFTLDMWTFRSTRRNFPQAIAQIFEKIDPVLDAEVVRSERLRSVMVISPARCRRGSLPSDALHEEKYCYIDPETDKFASNRKPRKSSRCSIVSWKPEPHRGRTAFSMSRLCHDAIAPWLGRSRRPAIYNLAVLYMQIGQTYDAVAALRYGIGVAPKQEMLCLNLARIYVQSGEWAKAGDVRRQSADQKSRQSGGRKALQQLGML